MKIKLFILCAMFTCSAFAECTQQLSSIAPKLTSISFAKQPEEIKYSLQKQYEEILKICENGNTDDAQQAIVVLQNKLTELGVWP